VNVSRNNRNGSGTINSTQNIDALHLVDGSGGPNLGDTKWGGGKSRHKSHESDILVRKHLLRSEEGSYSACR